jgi:hypothetical protein
MKRAGERGQLVIGELRHEQLTNAAQMDGRGLRQPSDTGRGEADNDAPTIRARVGSADQTLIDESIDPSGHTGARAVRLSREVTDSHFSAGLAKLSQHVEVSQSEANVFDEIRGQLPHEGGVRLQEGPPRVEALLARDRLGHQLVEECRDIGLLR